MYIAQFIHIEDGETDLILSFALDDEGLGVRSLTLLRTPMYEEFLDETERGVHISMEGEQSEHNLLQKIVLSSESVAILGSEGRYEVAVTRIEPMELKKMRSLIKKLNFDSNFTVANA